MTDGDVKLISARLESMESLIERIETLLQKEISDLKTEQIADLRRQIERIADDQRRSWDAIRALETVRDRAHGGGKVLSGLVTGLIAIVSSSAAAVFITKFMK